MKSGETLIEVTVRAKGAAGYLFQSYGPNPSIPRVGEFVRFSDGLGRVESVTWDTRPDSRLLLVVVECVPEAAKR